MKDIEKSLIRAGNLNSRPLAIYGSDKIPDGSIPLCSLDRCVAKGILMAAVDEKIPTMYMGKDSLKGCCMGAMTWFGFVEPHKYLKYFVSTGNKKFRDGEAEFLKSSPEIYDQWHEFLGEITPPGKYLLISKFSDLEEEADIKSVVCFGKGEDIRNLSSLIHFRTVNPFNAVSMAMGPSCATFVTYPARLAANTPKDMAFVGPVDPTGNRWFPQEYIALGIPFDMVLKMHDDVDNSFVEKRPHIAYPQERDNIFD